VVSGSPLSLTRENLAHHSYGSDERWGKLPQAPKPRGDNSSLLATLGSLGVIMDLPSSLLNKIGDNFEGMHPTERYMAQSHEDGPGSRSVAEHKDNMEEKADEDIVLPMRIPDESKGAVENDDAHEILPVPRMGGLEK
jgi:hypothetical protein